MRVGIQAIGSYFPEKKLFPEAYEYLSHYISDDLRPPREKRVLEQRNAADVLAAGAARKALEKAGLDASDVDFIIADHIGGDYIVPGLAGGIHHTLACRLDVPAWNLHNCCAGFIDGCRAAEALLRLNLQYRNVLLVVASAFHTGSWGNDKTDPFCLIAGDGAAAAIISRDEKVRFEFVAYANQTYNEIQHMIFVSPVEPPTDPALLERLDEKLLNDKAGSHLPRNFKQWTDETGVQICRQGVLAALQQVNLRLSDVAIFIPHQAGHYLIQGWQDDLARLGVPHTKWRHTWDKYGMIAAAGHPATLSELIDAGEIERNALIALQTVAGGGCCPTLLIRHCVV